MAATKRLPFFQVRGTHEDLGRYLGSAFKDFAQEAIARRRASIPGYSDYLQKSQDYLDVTVKYFPNLVAETKAFAEAAEVPLLDFFFMNNREVYDIAEHWDSTQAVNPDHCTVVVGNNNGTLAVGHNEDWTAEAIDEIVVLEATIDGTTFVGLHYMYSLAGVSAAMNSHGLVQCINDVYQSSRTVGVPKNYVARAILEAKTLDEAEKIIRDTPKASGFNHVLVQGNEVRNIEIAGNSVGVEQVINAPYVHTNHYLTLELQALEKFHTQSSEARYDRAREMITDTMTVKDVEMILKDSHNSQYPICRPDDTIASAVFEPSQKIAKFCYGHPCAGEYVAYSLAA